MLNCVRDISGEFGVVYRGHLLKDRGQTVTETVAIKTLKGTQCLAQSLQYSQGNI